MKKIIVLSALLVMLAIPGLLLAQGACPSKMVQKEKPELTEEQLAKLESMKTEHRIATIKLEADLEVFELQLQQEMMKDDPSAKELQALVSKIGDVREKLQMNRINHMLQVRKIVGPENWKRMGMQGCGMGECGMMDMKDRGGCCGMGGGHRGMGEGCCGMDRHRGMGEGCRRMGGRHAMGMGRCGMGEEMTGGARTEAGGCMGGKEGTK